MSSFLEKIKQQKLLSVTLLLFTLVLGIVLGTLINTGVKAAKDGSTVASDATPITVPQATQWATSSLKLAKRLEPSVVYIHSDYLVKPDKQTKQPRGREDQDDSKAPQDPQDMLRKFFGRTVPPRSLPAGEAAVRDSSSKKTDIFSPTIT